MARIEEETVAQRIGGIVGIVFQELGIEDVDKVGTAIAPPGWPDFDFSTIEAASIRILSAANVVTSFICFSFALS